MMDAALFEHAACGLLVARADGVIIRVNATLCNWLGETQDQLLAGRKLDQLFSMGGRVFHQTHCLPMLQVQGSVAEVQVDLLHRDRSRLPMLMNIARRLEGGAQFDHVAFFLTVERRSYERELLLARREAEQALEARRGAELQLQALNAQLSQADRRKDEFLATLAHELRNPLAPVRNAIELLKMQAAKSGQASRPLQVLERQVGHLAHLVDDLMEISRITQGHVALRRETIDLASAIRAAADDAMPVIAAAGHRLDVSLPQQAMWVDADATRLMQVVLNLLTNAAKYTPHGGRIVLTARRDGAHAQITVADNGIGIPAQSLGAIFEMFSQLTPALDRAQGGLGIGLALVRGLVELHGGSIRADSAGVGQGSVFTVRLPALDGVAAPVTAPVHCVQPDGLPNIQRILVVDDNPDATDTMCAMLELHGHLTQAAHDGASACSAAAQFAPTVILLDIGLPDMNGYDVARRVRAAPGGGKVFMVAATGWGQQDDQQRAFDAGFDRHLTKPIDFAALQQVLAEAAARRP
ncbi:MAG: ATP-binding protein [Massilia sp.]